MTAQPPTETLKLSQVRQGLNALVNRVHRRETRVRIEKNGIPVAAIVSAQDLQRLEQLDRERAEHIKALYEFAAGFADQTPEEIERETAKAIAEVRAEKWGERERAVGD
jgi:prevent-host-death family protein